MVRKLRFFDVASQRKELEDQARELERRLFVAEMDIRKWNAIDTGALETTKGQESLMSQATADKTQQLVQLRYQQELLETSLNEIDKKLEELGPEKKTQPGTPRAQKKSPREG